MTYLKQRFNSLSSYQKMISLIFLLGFISLFIVIGIIIYSINSTKNNIIEKVVNAYITKPINIEDGVVIKLIPNEKIVCNSTTTYSFKTETECTLKMLDIYGNTKKLGTANNISVSLITGLFDRNIIDLKTSGFAVNGHSSFSNLNQQLIYGNSEVNIKQSKIIEDALRKVVVNFSFFTGEEKRIKDGSKRLITLSVDADTDSIIFAKKMSLDLIIHYKPVVKKILSESLEDNVSSNVTLTLPFEKIFNYNKTLITTKNREDALKTFYAYYSYSFDNEFDTQKFNQFYLNVDQRTKLSYNDFIKAVIPLTKQAASGYALSSEAPLAEAVSHLFSGQLGSAYIVERKDNIPGIASEYLEEISKIDSEKSDALNIKHYDRKVIGCDNAEECFKALED